MLPRVSHKRRRYRVPKGFARNFAMLRNSSTAKRRYILAVALALLVHGGVASLAVLLPAKVPIAPSFPKALPIVVATRSEPPPPAAPVRVKHTERPAAAAQTAKVIARAPDATATADLTDFAIVTGASETFAGGNSTALGTSAKVVTAALVESGKGTSPSLERAAMPARRDWNCSWPADAEATDLLEARVSARVAVDQNGSPASVEIVESPALSFATAARRCAMSERYEAGLDRAGRRVASVTSTFFVHFSR